MKRRNFFTAAAFLAAPLSLFARKPHPGDPYAGPINMDEWYNATATYNEESIRKWTEEHEKDVAARKKAAGPWRIVEQTEDELVVLERESDGKPMQMSFVGSSDSERKVTFAFQESHGSESAPEVLREVTMVW